MFIYIYLHIQYKYTYFGRKLSRKRGKDKQKPQKKIGFFSSKFQDDKDFSELKELYSKLKKKYNLSAVDIIGEIEHGVVLPCSIFNKKLSPLETVSKYFKENLDLSFKEIAKLINRSEKTIWQAYSSSKKKYPSQFEIKEFKFIIPVSKISDRRYSLFENIVWYLKTDLNLSYHKIAVLLKRDDRTIWTVYHRAEKKRKHGK